MIKKCLFKNFLDKKSLIFGKLLLFTDWSPKYGSVELPPGQKKKQSCMTLLRENFIAVTIYLSRLYNITSRYFTLTLLFEQYIFLRLYNIISRYYVKTLLFEHYPRMSLQLISEKYSHFHRIGLILPPVQSHAF